MKTIWGEQLNPAAVLQEYPRPQLRRGSYVNLNGEWDYAICSGSQEPAYYDGKILVPFSPEAPLSGVGRTLLPGQTLWYRSTLTAERRPGQRLLLHFGAADQRARVFCNGLLVAEHVGGYTAFTADLTDALEGENVLSVQVQDDTDACELSRGKQKTKRGGIWYTPQSGIWQTVWAEWVPETYISGLRITPNVENRSVKISVLSQSSSPCYVLFQGRRYGGYSNREINISVENPVLWMPEQPHLYDFSAELGQDHVDSYFALRSVGVGPDERGVKRLLLNGRPYFHTGVLDQGYWPDGLYTAPSDAAMVADIQMMKDCGFNMLRKHIKLEPMRWYYHCDRLGMLVWQDMISGGGQYNPFVISAPLVTGRHKKDDNYKRFARRSAEGRKAYYRELRELVLQLYNCPSVVMWVPFNEGWGQFDAQKAVNLIESLDKTRTIDHASGWHDQKIGEIQSLHVYFKAYKYRPDTLGRAVVLSEFGGYNLRIEGHCWNEKSYGYRAYRTLEALQQAFTALYASQILSAREKGLAACVYTQLSDVEDELNGLLTYDRKVCKLDKDAVREGNLRLVNGEA